MADDDVAPKRRRKKIKYATGGDEFSGAAITRPGARAPWGEDADNPLSPNFVPLTERTELGIARFWAAHERRRKSTGNSHVVYD